MSGVRVGVSGWTYPPWRGVFYPVGMPHRRELAYAAGLLNSIELNGSFYALQRPASYLSWRDQTPDGFVFSVKGGRFITHLRKLAGVETALANFFASGVLALGDKLGPILWQLPPTLPYDRDRLAGFFGLLPRSTRAAVTLAHGHDERLTDRHWLTTDADRPLRHALEVRHPSYAVPDFLALVRDHDIGLVVADTAGKWPLFTEVTSDFVYIRLHGAGELYVGGYDDEALTVWAERAGGWVSAGLDVYVYFDNDVKVRAPVDAMNLANRLGVGPGRSTAEPENHAHHAPPGGVRHNAPKSGPTALQEHAMRLRADFGLLADLAHVRAVARAHPSPSGLLGIPLDHAERTDIRSPHGPAGTAGGRSRDPVDRSGGRAFLPDAARHAGAAQPLPRES